MTIAYIDGPFPWAIIENGVIQGRFESKAMAENIIRSLGGGE